MRLIIASFIVPFLLACSDTQETAFYECRFELTKVLALRDKPFDKDATMNQTLARAFIGDCMLSKRYNLTEQQRELIR